MPRRRAGTRCRRCERAIETIRSRCGVEKLVEVIHTDLPSHDFSSLFTVLQQDPDSYLRGMSGVFPAAIGRSYFEPLLPPGRVHLGWNTFSMQWMSRSPADAPDHILAGMSSQSASAQRRASMSRTWRSSCYESDAILPRRLQGQLRLRVRRQAKPEIGWALAASSAVPTVSRN
jgi:hypothetical protein